MSSKGSPQRGQIWAPEILQFLRVPKFARAVGSPLVLKLVMNIFARAGIIWEIIFARAEIIWEIIFARAEIIWEIIFARAGIIWEIIFARAGITWEIIFARAGIIWEIIFARAEIFPVILCIAPYLHRIFRNL